MLVKLTPGRTEAHVLRDVKEGDVDEVVEVITKFRFFLRFNRTQFHIHVVTFLIA